MYPAAGDSHPNKIICIGVNYAEHAGEAGLKAGTDYPTIFLRLPEVLIGNGQPLIRPRVSEQFDYEGELAVVMGKAGSHIAEADAMSYVAGYSCFNDASVRDWQFHTRQFGMGKNFRNSGPFGPWLVTADEIADYRRLTLRTLLNGEEVQRTTCDRMVFDVPKLISYVSQALPWSPGDVISHRHSFRGRALSQTAALYAGGRYPGRGDQLDRYALQSGGRRELSRDRPGVIRWKRCRDCISATWGSTSPTSV